LVIGREFVREWQVMAAIAALWFTGGILAILLMGNFVPGLGRSLANQFVDDDVALCRQLNNRFRTADCTMPDLRRRTALISIHLERRP
jgi:hypothetical protein